MHNNEERFRVAASFQFRSSRGAETNESERRGEKRRKSRQRGKSGGRQVFRLPELTKSLWREWKNYCLSSPLPLPMLKSLSESLHENLSINQKIYEFRIRNEELSLSLSLSWRIMSVCLGYATIDPAPARPTLGRGLDAFKLKQTI